MTAMRGVLKRIVLVINIKDGLLIKIYPLLNIILIEVILGVYGCGGGG